MREIECLEQSGTVPNFGDLFGKYFLSDLIKAYWDENALDTDTFRLICKI